MPAPGTGGVPRPQEPCRTDPMKPRERWGQVSIANAPAGHSAPMPMPRRAQRPDHRLLHDRARGADLHQQRHERIDNRVVRLDLPPDRRVHAGDAAFPGQPQQAELPYHRAEAGAGIPFDDAISLRDRRVPSCLAAIELRQRRLSIIRNTASFTRPYDSRAPSPMLRSLSGLSDTCDMRPVVRNPPPIR